jgi:uncharacterized membrane protein
MGRREGAVSVSAFGFSFGDQSREDIERLGRTMDQATVATFEFWKHLVLVEATVLGLGIGLFSTGDRPASPALAVGWSVLLVAVAIGLFLIRLGIQDDLYRKIRHFMYAMDESATQKRIRDGTLVAGSDEHVGLSLAAMVRIERGTTNPKVLAIAKKWEAELPSVKMYGPVPVGEHSWMRWPMRFIRRIEFGFYAASVIAFACLLLAVVGDRSATPRPHPASPRTSAVAIDTLPRTNARPDTASASPRPGQKAVGRSR